MKHLSFSKIQFLFIIESFFVFQIAETGVGGTAKCTFKFIPPYAGHGVLVAKFTCKELDDVDGFLPYEAEPRPEDVLINGNSVYHDETITRTDVIP